MIFRTHNILSLAGKPRTSSKQVPFVCQNKPFIGDKPVSIIPFVGDYLPFVIFKRFSGFTLVEMMIVLIVAAILASLAVPSFRATIQTTRIKTQAGDLVSAFQTARGEAAKQKTRITVCASSNSTTATPSCLTSLTDWHQGWIIWGERDTTAGLSDYDNELLLSGAPSPAGLTVIGSFDALDYFPDGSSTASGGTLTICGNASVSKMGRIITISSVGRPEISAKNDCGG